MNDLIEALMIFAKYTDAEAPLNCSHDLLWVNVDPLVVSPRDVSRLDDLGFYAGDEPGFEHGFVSYRFGSC